MTDPTPPSQPEPLGEASPTPAIVLQYSGPADSAPARNVAVVVPAIIGVVWGSTAMLWAAPQAIEILFACFRPKILDAMWGQTLQPSRPWLHFLVFLSQAQFCSNLLLLVASVACLRRARWSRRGMIVFAWFAIGSLALGLVRYWGQTKWYGANFSGSTMPLPTVLWLRIILSDLGLLIFPVWILSTFGKECIKQWFDPARRIEPFFSLAPRMRSVAIVGVVGVIWSALWYQPQLFDLSSQMIGIGPNGTRWFISEYLIVASVALGATVLLLCASTAYLRSRRWGRVGLIVWAGIMIGWSIPVIFAIGHGQLRASEEYFIFWRIPFFDYYASGMQAINLCRLLSGLPAGYAGGDFIFSNSIGVALLLFFAGFLLAVIWPKRRARAVE